MPIEELCARAIQELREVADGLRTADIAANATDRRMMLRSFALLSDGKAIGTDGYLQLDPVIRMLEEQFDAEPIDIFQTFDGHNDPEEGAVGTVVTHRIMSDLGEEIAIWLRRLRALCKMLQVAESRISAERLINRRMQF
ncbi:hypothetical protein ROE7235_00568 [Roseibaca ekhonensis]|uniref:Uncharacterized protein n=1 Tax=Roseinatronobacter ekhonensis TaxID=254356 RepID=A0A3B0MME8_9RHOB|nr:hypothetical protein [Roseibaca ekhonensis]SUZ30839.1 hypothetical protein ROE7235_00568 [Roseibaca ekhonensis]